MSFRNMCAAICGMFALFGCRELPFPDLHPDTPQGGAILIYEIGEIIEYTSGTLPVPPVPLSCELNVPTREIDLFDDGSVDILIGTESFDISNYGDGSRLFLRYEGELGAELILLNGPNPDMSLDVSHLQTDELIDGGSFYGLWASPGTAVRMAECRSNEVVFQDYYQLSYSFPVGLFYIPVRHRIGADDYYGWIECVSSDYHDDDRNELLLISRFGISQTPGLRIAMGQE